MHSVVRILFSSLMLSVAAVVSQGAPIITYVWTGLGEDGYVTTEENWDPENGSPQGEVGEALLFGDLAQGAHTTVIVPNFAAFQDVTFTGTGLLDYVFNGISTQSMVYLQNSVTVGSPGSVKFENALTVVLPYSWSVVANVAEDATLAVKGYILGEDDGGYVVKAGAGTLELSGLNSFGHGMLVEEGTLRLGSSSNLDGYNVMNGPVGTGVLTMHNDTRLSVVPGGNITLHNTMFLEQPEGAMNVDIADGNRLNLAGYIMGDGGILKSGAGDLVLSGDYSDFLGGVTVENGGLVLGASTSEWEGTVTGPLGSGGLTLLDGSSLSVEASHYYQVHNAVSVGGQQGTGTVTVDLGASSTLHLMGDLTGGADLVKSGAGLFVVDGYSNSYSGNITVDDGELAVGSGGLSPESVQVNHGASLVMMWGSMNSTVTVKDGGQLTGLGFVSDAVIEAGGLVSPGSLYEYTPRIATLSFMDLTLGGGSKIEIDVQHQGDEWFAYDQLSSLSSQTLTITADENAPVILKVNSLDLDGIAGLLEGGLQIGETYYLTFLSYQGLSGSLALGENLVLDTTSFLTEYPSVEFSLEHVSNSFVLGFTPIPEPSTYALMGLGLGVVALFARRMKRKV